MQLKIRGRCCYFCLSDSFDDDDDNDDDDDDDDDDDHKPANCSYSDLRFSNKKQHSGASTTFMLCPRRHGVLQEATHARVRSADTLRSRQRFIFKQAAVALLCVLVRCICKIEVAADAPCAIRCKRFRQSG